MCAGTRSHSLNIGLLLSRLTTTPLSLPTLPLSRTVPELLRPYLIPCDPPQPPAAAAAGPSTSTAPSAPPPPPSPPVPPPHIPVMPNPEPGAAGLRPGMRAAALYGGAPLHLPHGAGTSMPSARARSLFAGWYREGAPMAFCTDRCGGALSGLEAGMLVGLWLVGPTWWVSVTAGV